MPRFAQNVTIFFLHYISPKYLSKNACNFAIMPSFLAARLPPPKRETGGRMRSTSVPVVFNMPSRKELSTNLRVSSGLSFSSAISVYATFWQRTQPHISSEKYIPARPIKAAENWINCFTPCKQETLSYLTVYLVWAVMQTRVANYTKTCTPKM